MGSSARRLEKLLDKERSVLLEGDVQSLLSLAVEKERLIRQVEKAMLDPDDMERIGAKAGRNLNLLDAARRGILAAKTRIASVQGGPALRTYEANGRSSEVSERHGGLEKRA